MGNGALLGLHAGLHETDEDGKSIEGAQKSVDRWMQKQDHKQKYLEKNTNFHSIHIIGATGMFSCQINSVFVATGKMYNKRMLYRSANNWLRYAPDGKWIVCSTLEMEENLLGGFCHCGAFGLRDPSFAKSLSLIHI